MPCSPPVKQAIQNALDRLYYLWFPAAMFALAWFIGTRDLRFQLRGLLSYVLIWSLLGFVSAVSFASVSRAVFFRRGPRVPLCVFAHSIQQAGRLASDPLLLSSKF